MSECIPSTTMKNLKPEIKEKNTEGKNKVLR
jgi:hypothetical protein